MLQRTKSNLLDISPWFNWSDLICTPNRLSDLALNSMHVSKASDFVCTYPNLEKSSLKVMKYLYHPHAWILKVSYMSICTNVKNSLVLVLLVILPYIQDSHNGRSFGIKESKLYQSLNLFRLIWLRSRYHMFN